MLTEEQIQFLNKVCPDRWAEEKGVINVKGDFSVFIKNLTKLPVQFGKISGEFCLGRHSFNTFTTLEGCPLVVKRAFNCSNNKLTNLEGGPKEVGTYYVCDNNELTNLIGAPEICNGNFYCRFNKLTTLTGCPRVITEDLYCGGNPNLEYLWSIGRVKGKVDYINKNEINEWIIECMRKDIIFPHSGIYALEENINWIKREQKYSILLGAPEKIRKLFSPRLLHLVDMGSYNESKILDYYNESRILDYRNFSCLH